MINKPYAIIGRHPACDLSLNDGEVSKQHVYLQVLDGRLFCVDQGSRRGVLWKDKPRLYGWLDAGYWIQLGPYRLMLQEPVGDPDLRTMSARSSVPFLSKYKPAMNAPAQLVLKNDLAMPLQSQLATIGRSGYCNVELEGEEVSRFQACIVRTADGKCWLLDLLSRVGTKINRRRCQSVLLKHQDMIKIGDYTIQFQLLPRVEPRSPVIEHKTKQEPSKALKSKSEKVDLREAPLPTVDQVSPNEIWDSLIAELPEAARTVAESPSLEQPLAAMIQPIEPGDAQHQSPHHADGPENETVAVGENEQEAEENLTLADVVENDIYPTKVETEAIMGSGSVWEGEALAEPQVSVELTQCPIIPEALEAEPATLLPEEPPHTTPEVDLPEVVPSEEPCPIPSAVEIDITRDVPQEELQAEVEVPQAEASLVPQLHVEATEVAPVAVDLAHSPSTEPSSQIQDVFEDDADFQEPPTLLDSEPLLDPGIHQAPSDSEEEPDALDTHNDDLFELAATMEPSPLLNPAPLEETQRAGQHVILPKASVPPSALVLRKQQQLVRTRPQKEALPENPMVVRARTPLMKQKPAGLSPQHVKLGRPATQAIELVSPNLASSDIDLMDGMMQYMKQMQREMMAQMHMNMQMMVEFMGNLQKQQAEMIKQELAQLGKLNKELLELKQSLLTAAPPPAEAPQGAGKPVRKEGAAKLPPGSPSKSPDKPASIEKKVKGTKSEKPPVQPAENEEPVHAHSHVWISKRIALLEQERLTRWEKMKTVVMGK